MKIVLPLQHLEQNKLIDDLKNKFTDIYGKGSINIYFAPGRVNIIGEHIDYNGGHVLPASLAMGTYLALRLRKNKKISLNSTNFKYSTCIDFKDIFSQKKEWVKYPLGVIDQFQTSITEFVGFDLLFSGNLPLGAGLSSSAAIELVTAVACNDIFDAGLSQLELVKISQNAENNFVGVNCGIMDQFISGMGKKDHAMFLNCNTLEFKLIPFDLKDCRFIIANTNKQHRLTDSKYNERRSECQKIFDLINKKYSIATLCEIKELEMDKMESLLNNDLLFKRLHHIISENQRVAVAAKALSESNNTLLGECMNSSHNSLRFDYEVTGFELDSLVTEAQKIEGVLGSRMTGAGFGGCTINLVREDVIEKFITITRKKYFDLTGLKADFYLVDTGDRARRIE